MGHLRSVILNQPFTPCMLKSMICCVVQRDLKIRPKRLWSMLPDWLMSSVQSKTGDAYKAFQKSERRIKELQFQQDEDKKNQDSMSELANKLQMKIKTYKKQIEEAEEIA